MITQNSLNAKVDWLECRVTHVVPLDFDLTGLSNLTPCEHMAYMICKKLSLHFRQGIDFARHENVFYCTEQDDDVSPPVVVVAQEKQNPNSLQIHTTGKNANRKAQSLAVALAEITDLIRITRLDLAFDFHGNYKKFKSLHESFYLDKGMKPKEVSSFNGKNYSHSLYSASTRKNKATYVRLYEKGKEQGDVDSDWLRIEFELHPNEIHRECGLVIFEKFITGNLLACLPLNKWGSELYELSFSNPPPPYLGTFKRPDSTVEKAYKHLLKQYSKTIAVLLERYDLSDTITFMKQLDDIRQSGGDVDKEIDLFTKRLFEGINDE